MGSCCSKNDDVFQEALMSSDNKNNNEEVLVINPYNYMPKQIDLDNNENVRKYVTTIHNESIITYSLL
jgi:hypothetical protein